MQKGTLYERHGAWHLRYRVNEIGPDGKPRRREITKKLCDADRRPMKEVQELADGLLAPANRGGAAEGSLTIAEFVSSHFLPFVAARKKASTLKFYRDTLHNHVVPAVGDLRLRDIQTVRVQRMLDSIDGNLTHASLQRVKSAISAVMSHAIRLGFVTGANPVHEARPEGRRSEYEAQPYTWEDTQWMLAKLSGAPRLVVAVAAFTGLRLSEIRGLQWADYNGAELFVRRAVWRRSVDQTKTPESKGRVPLVAPLQKLLDAHRRHASSEWIFAGPRGFSLNLDNLARREIRPVLGTRFHGWKSFRSGLVGILFACGVDVEVAKSILRHSDSSVTGRHYLVLKSQREGRTAMKRLEQIISR